MIGAMTACSQAVNVAHPWWRSCERKETFSWLVGESMRLRKDTPKKDRASRPTTIQMMRRTISI